MKPRVRATAVIASATVAAIATFASPVRAQVWDGGGANDNWTTALNWDGDVAPANNGTALVTFDGAVRTTPNVDAAQSVNQINFAASASAFTIGGQALTIGSGGVVNNSGVTQTINSNVSTGGVTFTTGGAGSLTINGNITGLGGFEGMTKNGAGTLTLRGTNTFKGDVNVNGGTIDVFRVSQQFSGSNRTFNFNQSATLRMNATDAANLTAFATFPATLEVTQGWISVVSLRGSSSVAKTGNGYLELGLSNSSFSGRISVGGGKLIVTANNALGSTSGGTTVSNGASIAFMGGPFGGLNYTANEPLGITGDGHNGNGAIYNMGFSSNTFGGTVSLNGPSSISAETLGGTLTLSGAMANYYGLTVRDANVTIAGAISGTGKLIKAGGGTLTLAGNNTYTGGTEIGGGVLSIDNTSRIGPSSNDVTFTGAGTLRATAFVGSKSDVILQADGTIDAMGGNAFFPTFTGPGSLTKTGGNELSGGLFQTGALNVNAGSVRVSANSPETNTATSITIAAGATLNLADRNLVVTGQTLAAVESLVVAGCNGGAWNGTGGIITSQANALSGRTSLGVATADQAGRAGGTFRGVSLDADDVIVMYTWGGDANLDGMITGDDYSGIDFAIQVPGAAGWFNGDFNHDGAVTGDDYSVIDFNLLAQGAPFPASSSSVVAVPEPALGAFGAFGVAATVLIRRRRRT
jgi:autotransporter-associated beta strand protein